MIDSHHLIILVFILIQTVIVKVAKLKIYFHSKSTINFEYSIVGILFLIIYFLLIQD